MNPLAPTIMHFTMQIVRNLTSPAMSESGRRVLLPISISTAQQLVSPFKLTAERRGFLPMQASLILFLNRREAVIALQYRLTHKLMEEIGLALRMHQVFQEIYNLIQSVWLRKWHRLSVVISRTTPPQTYITRRPYVPLVPASG